MSDIREFPMEPPSDAEQVIEIRPLEVWPFLEAQWKRDRERLQLEAIERAMEHSVLEWLKGSRDV